MQPVFAELEFAELETEFAAARARRAQGEVGPAAAVGAIAQLVEGWRLETAPVRRVDVQPAVRAPQHAEHRRGVAVGERAAVVRVGAGDVAVARFEADVGMAQPGAERPVRMRREGRLRVLVEGAHAVVLP